MNALGRSRLIGVGFVVVVLVGFGPTTTISAKHGGNTSECSGKFQNKRPTIEELQEVLKSHRTWVGERIEQSGKLGKRANLCGAYLSGANLSRAYLYRANLTGANLTGAKLDGANLTAANLSGANLYTADLSGANLGGANLNGANLSGASLIGASLFAANLAGTRILLRSARQELPRFNHWQSAKNLAQLSIIATALTISAFQRLRDDFKKNGMRSEERGVTAALQRTQVRKANLLERIFRYIAFDVTSEYGNSPNRPLLILVSGIFLFMPLYGVALMIKNLSGRGAIWRVWSEERLLDISSDEKDKKKRERLSCLAIHKALLYGLYFSLLSAFHFGWRDLNVGNWISRIQPREYALRATGWVRAVSGVQSLLSVYLVALWALTYFGRPFE